MCGVGSYRVRTVRRRCGADVIVLDRDYVWVRTASSSEGVSSGSAAGTPRHQRNLASWELLGQGGRARVEDFLALCHPEAGAVAT